MKVIDLINKLSMAEKAHLAIHMAVKISSEDDYVETRKLDDEDYDGRCSLQATLAFDIRKAENGIESDIIHMTDLMDKYGLSIDYDNLYLEVEEYRKENPDETEE